MDYDPRYLAGILFFNQRDFFEAHEVWEDVWTEAAGPERRFYQGLIQAAVALHHFRNGNVRGALKLYRTGRAYMEPLGERFFGLDKQAFWNRMACCFQELHARPEPDRTVRLDEGLIPTITLDPPPETWPDLEAFSGDEE
jgi:predicted metal-dependent hydrolase